MLIPTLRESPAEAAPGAVGLMARAGYAKVEGKRVTAYLPLGQRCIRKMEKLLRRKMVQRNGQEFSFRGEAASTSHEPQDSIEGQEAMTTGAAGDSFRRGEDRILREIASRFLRSYRDLPQLWFHFGFVPRRTLETYSLRCLFLDFGEHGETAAGDPAGAALTSVLAGWDVPYLAASGVLDPERETSAREHFVLSPVGDAEVALCECGYAANLECATARVETSADAEPSPAEPELVETPDSRTIADVAELLGTPPASIIKSLLYIVAGGPVLALVRGHDQLNESLLRQATGTRDVRAATPDEVKAVFGVAPGSIGPVGQTSVRVLADRALWRGRNLVCGANKDGYHLVGVEAERDFRAEYFDLRQVLDGDPCPKCGESLRVRRADLVMRSSVFRSGTSQSLPLQVLGRDNKVHPVSASAHILFLDTLLLSLVGQFSDEDGIVLPRDIAPFDVVVTPIRYGEAEQKEVCLRIYEALTKEGADVLLDDRDCSPGVKFKDADLIGVPLRITVGPRKLKERKVELRSRRTGESLDCGIEEVLQPAARRLSFPE